jgi:hypothetical protein
MRTGILAAVLTIATPCSAIAQPRETRFGEETRAFRAVLNALGVKPIADTGDVYRDPHNKMLIVLGGTEFLDQRGEGRLKLFIENGGAILIATDRPTSEALYQEIGVRISGEPILTSTHSGNAYRNMAECPFVWEFGRPVNSPLQPKGFLFQNLVGEPRIATNLPSEIIRARNVDRLAMLRVPGHIAPLEYPRGSGRSLRDQSLFAVAGSASTWKAGRLLVLADQSIFINDMMLQRDNDNVVFAFNVVRWLTDAGDGKRRTEAVFYDDGRFQNEFDVPLEFPPTEAPPLEALVPLADKALVGLERENAFNKMLLEATGGPGPIMRGLAIFLTLCLLLAGLYRFMNARHRPDSRAPNRTDAIDGVLGIPASERRQLAAVAQGNLAEAARELTYQAFLTIGLTPIADSSPPAVAVPGWLPFRAWRWNREVRDLWNLAIRGPDRRISPRGLQRLDATLRALLAAVDAGTVRLATAESAI